MIKFYVFDDEESKAAGDECYDKEFARINKIIASTKQNSRRFDRISTSNKFTIKSDNNEDDNDVDAISESEDGTTRKS